MSTRTAKTDPGTGYHPALRQQSLLTEEQTRMVNGLPAGHEFVGVLGRTPIVRRPDGHLSRMRTSGRLVKTEGVQAIQSYLLVQG
jgi:hypothetical protein